MQLRKYAYYNLNHGFYLTFLIDLSVTLKGKLNDLNAACSHMCLDSIYLTDMYGVKSVNVK